MEIHHQFSNQSLFPRCNSATFIVSVSCNNTETKLRFANTSENTTKTALLSETGKIKISLELVELRYIWASNLRLRQLESRTLPLGHER